MVLLRCDVAIRYMVIVAKRENPAKAAKPKGREDWLPRLTSALTLLRISDYTVDGLGAVSHCHPFPAEDCGVCMVIRLLRTSPEVDHMHANRWH